MMGIFTGVKTNYLYVNDKTKDHGRVYIVDMGAGKKAAKAIDEYIKGLPKK